jgi:hypothetical protein
MIKSDKKYKELDTILNGGNTNKIIEAIKSLREEIPYEGAIGLLIDHYHRSINNTVRKLISDFMNDIKDQSVRPEVVAELKKYDNSETLRMLVSSCWQSGLDYSEFSDEFVRVFLAGDYMTAIECFSVIESSAHNLSRAKKDKIISMMHQNISGSADEKTGLIHELIAVLSLGSQGD